MAALPSSESSAVMAPSGGMAPEAQVNNGKSLALESDEELMMLEAPKSYEQRLEMAQKIAGEDPKRVAQVMKTWIKE